MAPNHKSFWDSFFIAVCTRRHLRFMAKTELIEARYGRLLVRLGAFPVRRGSSDADALETARTILDQGGLLALFPEGTRIRDPDELGHPKRGAGPAGARDGRAAGARRRSPAPSSSSSGRFPKPRRVQVAFAEPIPAARAGRDARGGRASWSRSMLWPEVEGEFRRLRARPTADRGRPGRAGRWAAGCWCSASGARSAKRSRLPWRR